MNSKDEKRWPRYLVWANYIIWAFLLFTIIYDLFGYSTRALFWILELGIAMFIYYRFKLPAWAYMGVLAFLLANLFGEVYLGFFYSLSYYDKIIHLLSPLIICTMLYFMLEKKAPDKKTRVLLSVSILLSFELIWEILEYFSDLYLGTFLTGVQLIMFENSKSVQVMPSYQDTIYDMLFNLAGSLVFMISAWMAVNRKK